jgi:Na+-driven multidrug efflux pump
MVFMDGLYLAHLSQAAFNGLLLALPWVSLVSALGSGIAGAAANLISEADGRGDASGRVVLNAYLLAAGLGAFLLLSSGYAGELIAAFYNLGRPEMASERATFFEYWRWISDSFPLQIFLMLQIQVLVLLGHGRRVNRLLAGLLAANAVLNPLLIFAAGLGVKGSALATNVVFLAGWLWSLSVKPVRADQALWTLRDFIATWEAGAFRRLAWETLMIFVATGVFSVGAILLNAAAFSLGPAHLTAWGICSQFRNLVSLPTRGICSAHIFNFGTALAKGRSGEYAPIFWASCLAVAAVYLPAAMVAAIQPGLVVQLHGVQESRLAALSGDYLRIAALILVANVVLRITQVGFLGLGLPSGLAIQSVVMVSLDYACTLWLIGMGVDHAPAWGMLMGDLCALLLVGPVYWHLLQRRRKADAGRFPPSPAGCAGFQGKFRGEHKAGPGIARPIIEKVRQEGLS